MSDDLEARLALHDEWSESRGVSGKQLVIEYADLKGVDWSHRLLLDVVVTECSVDDSAFVEANLGGGTG